MPYRKGYNLLPGLEKLKLPIFEVNERERFISLKKEEILKQECFFESEMESNIYDIVCDFIISNYPIKISGTFSELALQMREDLVIHRISSEKDWLASGHICFPSGWDPALKIGRSFLEIHRPIPGMRLSNSRKLVEAMVYSPPFERYVWGLIFEDRVSGHPNYVKKSFDPEFPKLWVKYERQVVVGFPDILSSLFSICQYLIPEDQIDKSALRSSLELMTIDQRVYKGLNNNFEELLLYLG